MPRVARELVLQDLIVAAVNYIVLSTDIPINMVARSTTRHGELKRSLDEIQGLSLRKLENYEVLNALFYP